MNWWFTWFFTMFDDEIIHSLFIFAAMKETNECLSCCFGRGKIYEWCFIVGNTWNNSSVLYHGNNHKASIKKSKENKIVKKLKNKIQQKRQRKRNWNVRASERIINWCVRKSEMLLRKYWQNKWCVPTEIVVKSLTLFKRTPLLSSKRISNDFEHSSMKKYKPFRTSKRKTMLYCK